jgi:pimeloyl-ACP methyl ester carboxylesterase
MLGAIVLVHGTMDESGSYRRVMDRLGAWNLVSYDRRGWGRSAKLGPASLKAHVEDLTEILVAHGPAVLAGHSFGGTVALTVAAQRPDLVPAVLAFEPPLPWLPWWPARAPWERTVLDEGRDPQDAAEALMRAVLGDAGWTAMPERIRNQRRAEGPVLVEEMRSLAEDEPSFDPESLACPVIVGAGSASLDHHRLVSRRLADLLPQGVYHELPQAGHPAHVTHPELFAELVVQAGLAGFKVTQARR